MGRLPWAIQICRGFNRLTTRVRNDEENWTPNHGQRSGAPRVRRVEIEADNPLLAFIATLYEVESRIRGRSAEARQCCAAELQMQSAPLVIALRAFRKRCFQAAALSVNGQYINTALLRVAPAP